MLVAEDAVLEQEPRFVQPFGAGPGSYSYQKPTKGQFGSVREENIDASIMVLRVICSNSGVDNDTALCV
jgi:hypothetical protein